MSKRNYRDQVSLTHWYDQNGPYTLVEFVGWRDKCIVLRPTDTELPAMQNTRDFLAQSKSEMPATNRTFALFPKRPLLCDACNEREAKDVFCIPYCPISLGFCQLCIDAGRPEEIGRETFRNMHGYYPYEHLNVQT